MAMNFKQQTRLAAIAAVLGGSLIASSASAVTYSGAGGPLVDATDGGTVVTAGNAFFDIDVSGTNAAVISVNSVTVTGLTHTFLGDTGIYLIGPSGAQVSLAVAKDNTDAQYGGTYTFVVDATKPTIDEATASVAAGSTLPSQTLAISAYGGGTENGVRTSFAPLSGEPLDGQWTLEIDDYATGDTGGLAGWSFNVSSIAVPEPTSIAAIGVFATSLVRRRR